MKNIKKKKNLLIALSLLLINKCDAMAIDKSKIAEIVNKYGNIIAETSEKEDDFLRDIYESDVLSNLTQMAKDGLNSLKTIKDETIDYDHDTLDIVTTLPNIDPKNERNYYFINSLVPALRSTKYLDNDGNEVKRNDSNVRYKVSIKKYHSITANEEDSKWFFEEQTIEDLQTGEIWTNTANLDKETPYINDEDISFGVFTEIEDVLPSEDVLDVYSLKLVKEYTTKINDLDTTLAFEEAD